MSLKMNKNNLSESVLLEEAGLPFFNTIVIISITLALILFVYWSSLVQIEEKISVAGQVVLNENSENQFMMRVKLDSKSILTVREASTVYISVPGVTTKVPLIGKVDQLNYNPSYDNNNKAQYDAYVIWADTEIKVNEFEASLIEGIEGSIDIVTGKSNLLQYLLGNLFESGKNLFN